MAEDVMAEDALNRWSFNKVVQGQAGLDPDLL
jgi:hypothetical protein